MRTKRAKGGGSLVTLLDALDDEVIFGRYFGPEWDSWRTFLKALFALPMTAQDLELYRQCTGRSAAPTIPAREAWTICGRRAGKSRMASVIAVYLAAFRDYSDVLSVGEVGTLPVIASDRRQARTCMSYIDGLIDEVPMLASMVVHRTNESVELETGVRIEVHTASWRALRGYTCVGAVADEVCFWRSEDSLNADVEIINALRPAMVTVPGAVLVAISSPYSRHGVAWEMHRRHHGPQGDPAILTWQAASRVMNATIPESIVTEALEADEAAARAEWCAEWRRDVEQFLSKELVDDAVLRGVQGVPPRVGVEYVALADPSGGSNDSFALAISHAEPQRDGQVLVVLDHVSERRPPFDAEQTVREFAATLQRYRVGVVVGDRYAGEWPGQAFQRHGISYVPSERSKSELYLEVLPMFSSGRVKILDHLRLLAQLCGLERRTTRSGRDSVDHSPGAHQHDDLANACAGALVTAMTGAVNDGPILAANVAPEDRQPLLDRRELEAMGRLVDGGGW
jgi:hypothetical protein